MANFGGTILTQKGINLITKALTGTTIEFTKIQLGDGVWDESVNPEKLTSLVSPKLDLPIQELEIVGDGTAKLRFILTNTGLSEGFFIREIGIFANDPDEGEVLYAVAYAEDADFIPADGGATKIESVIDIYTVVSNAQNVTAVISDSVLLATLQDIEDHNIDPEAHPDIRDLLRNVASSEAITQLKSNLQSHEADTSAHDIPGQISSAIISHNTDLTAHSDIRAEISALTDPSNPDSIDSKISAHNTDAEAHPDIRAALSTLGASGLFQENGYVQIGRLIIQWGVFYRSQGSGYEEQVTFPIAFPNECFVVVVTSNASGNTNDTVPSITPTHFMIRADYYTTVLRWIAIGH